MLGSRIKQGRLAAGMSLRELAQGVGLSAMAISKYERDQIKPSSETLLRLTKALGVRTEYFFRQPSIELTEVDFRKHAKLSVQDEAKALEDSAVIANIMSQVRPNDITPEQARQGVDDATRQRAADMLNRPW